MFFSIILHCQEQFMEFPLQKFYVYLTYSLKKEMATHSSVLVWRIPGMEEPGGLPSMGSHRVGHDWSDLAAAAATYSLILSSHRENQTRLKYLL